MTLVNQTKELRWEFVFYSIGTHKFVFTGAGLLSISYHMFEVFPGSFAKQSVEFSGCVILPYHP